MNLWILISVIILFMIDLYKDNHMCVCVRKLFLQPFPKRYISDSSNLKEFADDSYKFDKNDRIFLNG